MSHEITATHDSIGGKSPSIRSNILITAYVAYFLLMPRFVTPFVWNIIGREFGTIPSRMIGAVIFIIPALIYLLYIKFFEKRPIMDILSMRSLSLKNVLYITIITLAFAQTYSLIMLTVPFFLGDLSMPYAGTLSVWQYFLMGAVVASLNEEFVFRGVLWGEYRSQNVSFWKIALATGLFFGLIHGGILSIADTTFSGIFLYAPLIHFTRSIWAPILHHSIVNGRWWMHPVHFANNQAEYEALMPIYLIIMGVIVAILIPLAVICAKKFLAHNQHNRISKTDLPRESMAFKLTYWALIAAMLLSIVIFRI